MDHLMLLTRNDIPFISAELTIHQPTIKEIGMIGEDAFFTGAQFLTLTKNSIEGLSEEDAKRINNFSIILKLISDTSFEARYNKACAE